MDNEFKYVNIQEEGRNSIGKWGSISLSPYKGVPTNWIMLTPCKVPKTCKEISLKEAGIIS